MKNSELNLANCCCCIIARWLSQSASNKWKQCRSHRMIIKRETYHRWIWEIAITCAVVWTIERWSWWWNFYIILVIDELIIIIGRRQEAHLWRVLHLQVLWMDKHLVVVVCMIIWRQSTIFLISRWRNVAVFNRIWWWRLMLLLSISFLLCNKIIYSWLLDKIKFREVVGSVWRWDKIIYLTGESSLNDRTWHLQRSSDIPWVNLNMRIAFGFWNWNGRWTREDSVQKSKPHGDEIKLWKKICSEFNIYPLARPPTFHVGWEREGRRGELNQNQFRHCCQGKYEQEINFFAKWNARSCSNSESADDWSPRMGWERVEGMNENTEKDEGEKLSISICHITLYWIE